MPISADVNVPALTERVKKILTTPQTEWNVIEAEPTSVDKLYRGYIAPLAAIPVIASFIGFSIIGQDFGFLGTYRVGIVTGIAHAIVSFVLALVMVYVAALVINKLAPTFNSTPSDIQAPKLVAYAYTPAWVAGVFNIIPALMVLGILGGLYSIYLFYVGLPVMMKTPRDKVIPYMVVAALVIIVLTVIVGVVAAAITGVGRRLA